MAAERRGIGGRDQRQVPQGRDLCLQLRRGGPGLRRLARRSSLRDEERRGGGFGGADQRLVDQAGSHEGEGRRGEGPRLQPHGGSGQGRVPPVDDGPRLGRRGARAGAPMIRRTMTTPDRRRRKAPWLAFQTPASRPAAILLGIAVWVAFFGLWEAALVGGMVRDLLMPSPHHVLAALARLLSSADFWGDIAASVARILVSF